MSAPAPLNLHAMADAWDSPAAFAAQLALYYRQLRESEHIIQDIDWTTSRGGDNQ